MGTCRMGNTPDDSVLNTWCQTWDVPNLFVVDGSTLTTGAAVNPTSTIGALSQRTGEYLVRNFDAIAAQTTTPSHADVPSMWPRITPAPAGSPGGRTPHAATA